jgi:hypothetical protein
MASSTAVAPAPKRAWPLVVLWLLVVLDFLFESIWLSMVGDRATWEAEGIAPSGTAIGTLVAIDVALRVAIGLLVWSDLKALGAGRLKLSTVQATAFERTSPGAWGVLSAIFVLPCAVVVSMIRGRVRTLGADAAGAPSFPGRQQLRDAMRSPAYKEARKRNSVQTAVFFGMWVVMGALARL